MIPLWKNARMKVFCLITERKERIKALVHLVEYDIDFRRP
jgi:hypothetical protein